MGFCGLRRLKNQRNTFFICTSTRANIAVVVQIKIFLHYHYGAVARNISISYRKMGTWKSRYWNFTMAGKREEQKWKILSLKCKACVEFQGEINRMSTLKKTWIEHCSGGRLAAINDHCNGKPHMKTLCSFKASVLKIPSEVRQEEVSSLDKLKRLKRKVNFVAKNDISFRKVPNIVDLVTWIGILNF